jgi:hypothetical protein
MLRNKMRKTKGTKNILTIEVTPDNLAGNCGKMNN